MQLGHRQTFTFSFWSQAVPFNHLYSKADKTSMRPCVCTVALVGVLLLLPIVAPGRPITRTHSHHGHHHHQQQQTRSTTGGSSMDKPKYYYPEKIRSGPLEIAGSRLPDCSHACGSCKPCRLVMVSYMCASLEEAETCPMAYKCMCNSKSYPVP